MLLELVSRVKRIMILSNDTDVVMYTIAHYHSFGEHVEICYWENTTPRYIPLHAIAQEMGPYKSKTLLKAYVLTGCDYTSKIVTKYAAIKVHFERHLDNLEKLFNKF